MESVFFFFFFCCFFTLEVLKSLSVGLSVRSSVHIHLFSPFLSSPSVSPARVKLKALHVHVPTAKKNMLQCENEYL